MRPRGASGLSDDHPVLNCGLFSNTNANAGALANVGAASTTVTTVSATWMAAVASPQKSA